MLPILGFSIFMLIFAIMPSSNFVQNYFVTTNQVHPNTIHVDNIVSQSHKPSLTPIVMTSLHVPFIKNVGQSDSKVKFYANTFAGTVFVTNNGMTYSIPDPSSSKTEKFSTKENRTFSVIQENFENIRHLQIAGLEKSNTTVNYFIGNNKQDWHTNVPTYDAITLGTIWSGINLDLKAHGNNVEKIFTITPGANVHDIKIGVNGVSKLKSSDGNLLLYTSKGIVSMSQPIAYQVIHGITKTIDVSYVVSAKTYGFELGSYDKSSPVVIDPIIQSTYLGGSSDTDPNFLTLDSSGNVYVTGNTASTNFPGTTGGAQSTNGGGSIDVFVSKLNSNLTSLIQSTYLGGSGQDSGDAITLDSSGNVYVAGYTTSTNFPGTTGGVQTTNDGVYDVFVSKLNSGLTTLIQSTYLGGSDADIGNAITLDSSGNVYVAGYTLSTDFPGTTGGAQSTNGGGHDVFVSKLNSGLTTLVKSTYVGGIGIDIGLGMKLDSSGNVYVAGYTDSTNFPGTTGGAQSTNGGGADVFVSKLNSGLTSILQSTYLGGNGSDIGNDFTLDSSGNVYVAGNTDSTNFPGTTGGAQSTNGGGVDDVFVSKLNSGLTSILQSTYLGGSTDDEGYAIALDSSGNVYVAGYTDSTNFPGTTGGAQSTNGGLVDVFVSKLNSGLTTLIQSTYIGGSNDDNGFDIALDGSDNIYVTGSTVSTNFPGTTGGAQPTNGGNFNAFISKFNSLSLHAVIPKTLSDSISIPDSLSVKTNTAFVSTSTVGSGGTASVTLPSGTTSSITLPTGQSGTVTIQTTTAPTTSSGGQTLGFVGDVIDIVPPANSCATGCVFSFAFTTSQITAAGLTDSSQVKILHDHNNDGDFADAGETLTTTITTTSPDHFIATATDFFTSKFAIGGVVPALALLGHGGGPVPPPSFTLTNLVESNTVSDYIKNAILNHDPYKPIAPSNDTSLPYYPLSIDGKGYLLGGYTNKLQTVTEKTNSTVKLQLVTTADSIQHMALYANLQGTDPQISDSDTYVVYDEGHPLQIVDPHKVFSGVTFDLVKDGSQYKINYGIKFAKTMGTSDIVLRVWNERHVSSDVRLLDAWQVVQGTSSQDIVGKSVASVTVPNTTQNEKPSLDTGNSVDIMPAIKEWGGYSPNPISDSDLLKNVGINDAHSIPSWFMKTSKWVIDGDMSQQEFVDAIKYMHDKGMIK